MRQIEYYLQNMHTQLNGIKISEILKTTRFDFVPMLNPDGVDLSQLGLKEGTKLRTSSTLGVAKAMQADQDYRGWKANGAGVDINRNFNIFWEAIQPSGGPASEGYKGIKPESEPETKAIVNIVKKNGYDALISYHAMGSILYWYELQQGKAFTRDLAIAKVLSKITGYSLVDKSKVGRGGLRDWFVYTYKKPGFTIEVGRSGIKCPVPISEFSFIWKQNKLVPLELARQIQ
jgi:g-D-glutamyl-meso-diaminopimelate peptidase